MKSASVHIVLSDHGWILERLAEKLVSNIPSVTSGLESDPSADIQYYMTYSTWSSRVSRTEMGYFAHVEQDERTRLKFLDIARNVDFCICHSKIYEDFIRNEAGVQAVATIPPGVDLDLFVPKVKIGIVGRTYHTGRKGEAVMAAVMDVPGIEWHFTGSGWPGPALNLSDSEMPGFYRSMDYILVPSLYEGGPMSVVEALACGCEVIAPPIGWVPEFPHIEYRTGDTDHLRQVLTELVEKRLALRNSVLDRGWDNWINGHNAIFETLGAALEPKTTSVRVVTPGLVHRPGILVHGTETGVDKGGPSVRAPAVVKRLSKVGYAAELLTSITFDQRDHDLYHIFNLSRLSTCRRAIEYCRLSDAPVVLSTIFLDPQERQTSETEITAIFQASFSKEMINDEYARLRESRARRLRSGIAAPDQANEEFYAEVRQLIGLADHIICLSEHERTLLGQIGADVTRSTIVHNPVDVGHYRAATPELFTQTYGVTDYVLCVARLEPRKNQITLLHAMRDKGIPVVLVGHAPDPAYKQLLRSVAGPDATFIDRLPSNSRILASAYAGARVFCLPSWSEGAPLAALEAAAAGCSMVLSDRSSEQEYFGERARYCDPGNPEEMAAQILAAYAHPYSAEQRSSLSAWVEENYSWERHVAETAAVYEKVVEARQVTKAPGDAGRKIYIDLTSGANRSGPPSGIARVEERYALDLYDMLPGRVVFIVWNSTRRTFLEVSHDQFTTNRHKDMHNEKAPIHLFNQLNLAPWASVDFEAGAILLVLGGAWIRNENYIHSLAATKRVRNLSFVVFVHDVIQGRFKHWFPTGIGDEFVRNCRLIINAADHVIVNSQCTLEDLREMAAATDMICPPIDPLRFGDEIEKDNSDYERPQFDEILPLIKGKPFVLYVSALDIRKNHILLYNIWERMLAEFGEKTPHLIMVGSKGWSIDHFLELVDTNHAIKNVFHILHGINDATLSWLYRHCLFTVYPSRYEGWGLPVAESLNYGKVCIAAQAGSVPEIAPEVTDLIDPLDFTSWYKRIAGYVFNPNLLQTRREFLVNTYKPILWRESAGKLADLLANVHTRSRPAPVLRVGIRSMFDTAARNNSREIKVGGWYSPETDGTWTLGSMATLQFRLEGRDEGSPMVVELFGRGFVAGRDDFQTFQVFIDDLKIADLKWSGTAAADLVVVPRVAVAKMLASSQTMLEFRIARALIPANVRPNSTDKRELGLMIKSIEIRQAAALVLNGWSSEPAVISHRLNGGLAVKLPLVLPVVPADHEQDHKVLFLGLHLAIAEDSRADGLRVELGFEGTRLGEAEVKQGRSTARYFAVPFGSAEPSGILELSALTGDISSLRIVELGVFSKPPLQNIVLLNTDTHVNVSQNPSQKGGPPKPGGRHLSLLNTGKQFERDAVAPVFVAGWSHFENPGVWSDGRSALLLMRTARPGPMMLAFEVRAFRPMRVIVRVNGGPAQVWAFATSEFRQQMVFHTPIADDDGVLLVEFDLEGVVSPAELDGSSEPRRLGIMVAGFALMGRNAFATFVNQFIPEVAGSTLMDFTLAGAASLPTEVSALTVAELRAEQSGPSLLTGWSNLEKDGCWSDGEIANVALRTAASFAADDLMAIFDVRPYRANRLKIYVNGAREPQSFCFTSRAKTSVAVRLPKRGNDEPYLLSFYIDGAAAPAKLGESTDVRILGVYLRSVAIVPSSAWQAVGVQAKKKRRGSVAEAAATPAPAPAEPVAAAARRSGQERTIASPARETENRTATVDLSRRDLPANVRLENWWDEEIHGRWSRGAWGAMHITLPAPVSKRAWLICILRLAASADPAPRDVFVSVSGQLVSTTTIESNDFHLVRTNVTDQVAGKHSVTIEFRCSGAVNQKEIGLSPDGRDLGVHVRGLILAEAEVSELVESQVPGLELAAVRP